MLFITGIIYICLHCGWSKQLNQQYEEEEEQEERKDAIKKAQETDGTGRENLI